MGPRKSENADFCKITCLVQLCLTKIINAIGSGKDLAASACAELAPASCNNNKMQGINVLQKFTLEAFCQEVKILCHG